MLAIFLIFAVMILNPILNSFLGDNSTPIKLMIMAIIPIAILVFVAYAFTSMRAGSG